MGYTKNEWATGDTITAEKLNNLENGVKDASDRGIVVYKALMIH